jgi:predicted RNase H-like nuclease (RuvC/YqgF family)
MRELSGTNQDLRGRLDEQNKRMQQLQDQLEQIRRDLPK